MSTLPKSDHVVKNNCLSMAQLVLAMHDARAHMAARATFVEPTINERIDDSFPIERALTIGIRDRSTIFPLDK